MSLKTAIDDSVKAAFSVASDLLEVGDAISIDEALNVYDPVTGTYSGGERTDESIKILKDEFFLQEIDGQTVKQGDTKFMIQTSDLTYDQYNYFNLGSERWDVVNEARFPSDAARLFHVRLQND